MELYQALAVEAQAAAQAQEDLAVEAQAREDLAAEMKNANS